MNIEGNLIVDFPSSREIGQIIHLDSNSDLSATSMASSSTPSSSPTSSTKGSIRVRFADRIDIQIADRPSCDELLDRWYSPSDKHKFRKALQRTARKLATILASKVEEDKEMSVDELIECVGMEAFLSKGFARLMHEKRKKHSFSVLGEYCHQQQLGVRDDDHLAKVSKLSSKWSRERARNVAVGYWENLNC
mmetsp:Transcript_25906/g.52684  ORF Transcript_25906/g.52684 Transcript_25906/m.52684 type:complete len:192 (+) Transcript_25906:157-732(+)|eukprot:CAMPEP_0171342290 /NCGR_PEP_ID=MMETSP0878-20121228/13928_1 /TAXON_ID=67004 /ORGANISM="Thalassiosira weissflogii, Strain CCMP1336" /LENGTH=191 /DNA_ID=CAMNT_0011844915 /DNA_START=34 /DNA_END=609 /DNA_ORIENTATION=+